MMLFKFQSRSYSITEILEDIGQFEHKMDIFMDKYPYYNYELTLDKDKATNEWIADLNVERHEQTVNKDIEWDI